MNEAEKELVTLLKESSKSLELLMRESMSVRLALLAAIAVAEIDRGKFLNLYDEMRAQGDPDLLPDVLPQLRKQPLDA